MTNNNFNILSIDGGGLRGVYPVVILKRMQEELGVNLSDKFHLIAGTSTGAIIAAGLACGILPEHILDLYKYRGEEIFRKKLLGGIVTPKYDNKYLKNILDQEFGEKTFNDVDTRLMITATNISDGIPWVFKSFYNQRLTRDRHVKLQDAVMASCSAPLYFNPYEYEGKLLADGGLWANNPALVAFVEVLGHNIKVKRYRVRLISIGTGINIKHYPIDWIDKQWGATRWGIGLIDTISNMQSLSVERYLETIMKEEQYLRINFELSRNLTMDDTKAIDELIVVAERDYYQYEDKIRQILTI